MAKRIQPHALRGVKSGTSHVVAYVEVDEI